VVGGGLGFAEPQKHEEVVSRGIGHELEVVGRVLVVRRDVERHGPLQELSLAAW